MSPPAAGAPWTPRTGWGGQGGQWGTPVTAFWWGGSGSRTLAPDRDPAARPGAALGTPPPPFSGVGSQNQIAMHSDLYPRRWVDAPRDERARARFAVATLNLEADAAKSAGHSNGRRDGSKPAGEDVNAAFVALGQALTHCPDVLCLQEMQRCSRHNCPSCASGNCRLDHAAKIHAFLLNEGFDGDYKRDGRPLTVGLYVRSQTFTLESKVRTVRFASGKGVVLAVARHLGTGQRVALGSRTSRCRCATASP